MEDEFYEERKRDGYEEETRAYDVDDEEDEMAGFYAGYNGAYDKD